MRTLLVGLTAFTFAMAAGAALAQSTPAPAAPMAAMPGMTTAKPSVKSTPVGDLLANPAAKGVLQKDMPGLLTHPNLQKAVDAGMTLTDIEAYSDGKIDDALLAKVQADFDALPAQ